DYLFMRFWSGLVFKTQNEPNFPKDSRGLPAFNITRIPGKTKDMSAAALGGFQLAVNKHTRNVDASVKAIRAMMTTEFQMKRLEVAKVWPTIPKLLTHPLFCALVPYCNILATLHVTPRPSAATSPYYLDASQEIFFRTSRILRDEVSVEQGLKDMKVAIEKAIRRYQDPALLLGPPEFVDYKDPAGIFFMVLAGIMTLLSLALFFVILSYRQHKILSAASPLFLLMMVVGTCVGHAAIFAYTGPPSTFKCGIQPWLVVGGYSLVMAAMVARTWRIYKVFRNTYSMTRISNIDLLKTCSHLIALNVFLLSLWIFFTPPIPTITVLKESQFWVCQNRNPGTGWILMGLLFFYNTGLLGVAVFLTAKTFRVEGIFNESKYVGYAVYTMVLVNVILIPLSTITAVGATFQYIFRCLAIELSALAITCNMFLPKVVGLFWHHDFDEYAISESFKSSSTPAPGSELESLPSYKPSSSLKRSSTVPAKGIGGGDVMHQIVNGRICVRYASTRWGLAVTSWRTLSIAIVPTLQIMALFAPQGVDSIVRDKDERGLAIEVRSVVIEDYSSYTEEFIFEAVINGSYFQFQVGSSDARKFWVDALS
ncbi:hypothetical protein HDU67_002456, partial [Dinochytrium kinnereticum]